MRARTTNSEETVKVSPVALLKELVKRDKEIAVLKANLARHDDGSLFDLRHDSADDIAVVSVNNVTEHKAKAIAKVMAPHSASTGG